jgi:hypothetical protein
VWVSAFTCRGGFYLEQSVGASGVDERRSRLLLRLLLARLPRRREQLDGQDQRRADGGDGERAQPAIGLGRGGSIIENGGHAAPLVMPLHRIQGGAGWERSLLPFADPARFSIARSRSSGNSNEAPCGPWARSRAWPCSVIL